MAKKLQLQENQSTTDFSSATLDTRRQWNNIYLVFQEKYCDPRILHCPIKYSYGKRKIVFQLKKTHNECHPSIFLSKLLKGVL